MPIETYSVETTARVTIALHLQSSVHSVGDIYTESIRAELNMRQTELAQAGDLEGLDEGDIVVITGVTAERKQDFDSSLAVTHLQGDREGAGDGELSTV
jgi:hypothetical protein